MSEEVNENPVVGRYRLEASTKGFYFSVDESVAKRAEELGLTEDRVETMTRYALRTACNIFGVREEDVPFKGIVITDFDEEKTRFGKLHARFVGRKSKTHNMEYQIEEHVIRINLPKIDSIRQENHLTEEQFD